MRGTMSAKMGLALISGLMALCSLGVPLAARGELSCRDEQGNAVDWFIAYKFPKINEGGKPFSTGHAYAYFTSNDVNNGNQEDPQAALGNLADPDDTESSIFLHRFRDLLVRFAGGVPSSHKAGAKSTGKRKKSTAAAGASDKLKWSVSEHLISDPDSAVFRTLAPVYEQGTKLSSIFYNDDPTGTDSGDSDSDSDSEGGHTGNARRAHAKGTLLMDEESNGAVWITHSIPKFPTVRRQPLEYPASGRNNGQTLMCVSLDLQKSGNQLVNHLFNMRPLVYDREVSDALVARFPSLKYLDLEANIKGKRLPVKPTLAQTITTRGGQVINLFSKSISFAQDLWDGWIDDELGADLYVQTWRRGAGGVLDSVCPANHHHVNNINDLRYDSHVKWSYIKDHSKWAISDEEQLGTVCIGDSNRMASQAKRGGGAVCMKCPACWSVFSATILDTEPCPLRDRKNPSKKDTVVDRSLLDRIRETLHL